MQEKLKQKDLFNKDEIIKEIEELREYKKKYEEMLEEKKDNKQGYADIPYLEPEEKQQKELQILVNKKKEIVSDDDD